MVQHTELDRITELADLLAERILASLEKGDATVNTSPEARLLLQVAKGFKPPGSTSRPACVAWPTRSPLVRDRKLDGPRT
jgi:hypothetical protein